MTDRRTITLKLNDEQFDFLEELLVREARGNGPEALVAQEVNAILIASLSTPGTSKAPNGSPRTVTIHDEDKIFFTNSIGATSGPWEMVDELGYGARIINLTNTADQLRVTGALYLKLTLALRDRDLLPATITYSPDDITDFTGE